jgi:hypothetical protein
MVHETYTNSESVLAHITGVASKTIFPKIFNMAKINRLGVYGNPSEELQKVLTSFDSQTFNLSLDSVVRCWIISLGLSKVNVFYRNKSTSLFHFI